MKDKKRKIFPRSVISRLANIIAIAIGNILIVAGESLIHYGKSNIDLLLEEESKKSLKDIDEDDFFDYR